MHRSGREGYRNETEVEPESRCVQTMGDLYIALPRALHQMLHAIEMR